MISSQGLKIVCLQNKVPKSTLVAITVKLLGRFILHIASSGRVKGKNTSRTVKKMHSNCLLRVTSAAQICLLPAGCYREGYTGVEEREGFPRGGLAAFPRLCGEQF